MLLIGKNGVADGARTRDDRNHKPINIPVKH